MQAQAAMERIEKTPGLSVSSDITNLSRKWVARLSTLPLLASSKTWRAEYRPNSTGKTREFRIRKHALRCSWMTSTSLLRCGCTYIEIIWIKKGSTSELRIHNKMEGSCLQSACTESCCSSFPVFSYFIFWKKLPMGFRKSSLYRLSRIATSAAKYSDPKMKKIKTNISKKSRIVENTK